jgi:hypothetical protein
MTTTGTNHTEDLAGAQAYAQVALATGMSEEEAITFAKSEKPGDPPTAAEVDVIREAYAGAPAPDLTDLISNLQYIMEYGEAPATASARQNAEFEKMTDDELKEYAVGVVHRQTAERLADFRDDDDITDALDALAKLGLRIPQVAQDAYRAELHRTRDIKPSVKPSVVQDVR